MRVRFAYTNLGERKRRECRATARGSAAGIKCLDWVLTHSSHTPDTIDSQSKLCADDGYHCSPGWCTWTSTPVAVPSAHDRRPPGRRPDHPRDQFD